jgi:hypothetical protein
MLRNTRRIFSLVLGTLLLALSHPAAAQQTAGKVPRIGFLTNGSASDPAAALRFDAFRQGLGASATLKGKPSLSSTGMLRGDRNDYRRVAYYVDRILKGAKPADLPVQQATKFEFIINLKAAKQIGLTIPVEVLARANRVIK